MKKILVCALAALMALSLAACGRRKTEPTTLPTSQPTTRPTVLPDTTMTMPTMDTNIPDPDINQGIPDMTQDFTGEAELLPNDGTQARRK